VLNSDAQILIDFIHKSDYKLNPWESDFLQKIEYMVKQNYKISCKQSQALNKLYSKSYNGGNYQGRQRI